MNAATPSQALAPVAGSNAEWHARRLAATPRGVAVFGEFYIDRA